MIRWLKEFWEYNPVGNMVVLPGVIGLILLFVWITWTGIFK